MSLKDKLLTAAVGRLLDYKTRAGAIDRVVRGKTSPRVDWAHPPGTGQAHDRVTVGAVQMEFNLLDDGAQFAEKIYGLARRAVEGGAQMVAFPEYAWTPLAGMLPGVRDLAGHPGVTLDGAAEEASGGGSTKDIFLLLAQSVERAFVATGQAVARALGIYLMSGSTIARDEPGHLFNSAYLFGPEGQLIGSQRKLHPDPAGWERGGLTVGTSLRTFQLPFARVAMPVCMDFTYWETTRLAWVQGAEVLFDMAADDRGDEPFLAARGARTRVQEAPAYGILPRMVTDLLALHWRGPSEIVTPSGLDPKGSILARTTTTDREEVVIAELDLARLREFREAHAPEFNRTLLQESLPRAYGQYRDRVRREGKRSVK